MTDGTAPRVRGLRWPVVVVVLVALAAVVIAVWRAGGPAAVAVAQPSAAASTSPTASTLLGPSSSAAAAAVALGTIGPGGRLDGPAVHLAAGNQSLAYGFDVAPGAASTDRLRVTLDLSNRDDCLTLRLISPNGIEAVAAAYDYPTVCPLAGRSGQSFNIEWSTIAPAPGPWRAVVDVTDVAELSLRLRVSLDGATSQVAGAELYPDLIPWLPWEFGFAAPASNEPGTAHDRLNQAGPATVSCHPVEEPGQQQCLRFSAGIYNVGAGPLYVSFRDDAAIQHVYRADSTPWTYGDNEGAGAFAEHAAGTGEWHPFHQHRHLAEFVQYELFAVTGPTGDLAPVGTGAKHGYCTFSQQIADWASTAQDPQYASFPDAVFCDDAMTLERGWGDIYRWQRPGQYVAYGPVAEPDGSMRAGRYLLRFVVDPADHVAEADETNNVGYALIEVVDGGGPGEDEVVVCEQGLGRDPWDPSHQVVEDRFAWAKTAADPAYVAPSCG